MKQPTGAIIFFQLGCFYPLAVSFVYLRFVCAGLIRWHNNKVLRKKQASRLKMFGEKILDGADVVAVRVKVGVAAAWQQDAMHIAVAGMGEQFV